MSRPSTKKGKAGRKSRANSQVTVPRQMSAILGEYRIYRKVLSANGSISTGGTGFLGVLTSPDFGSAFANSATNFSGVGAGFMEYRCAALEVQAVPVVNSCTTNATPPPTAVAVSNWGSGLLPTTFAQVVESNDARFINALRPFKISASMVNRPNAQFWTAINATQVAGNSYGIVIADQSVAPAATATSVYFRFVAKYLVEFRSLL